MTQVLFVGEGATTVELVAAGTDVLARSSATAGADRFVEALTAAGADVTRQWGDQARREFPRTAGAFDAYDLVVVSDVGADTLQITPRAAAGEADVDRLAALADYVRAGGAVGMLGGYLSFAGAGGAGRYGASPLADVLPVRIARHDDRIERPAGATPRDEGVPGADLPDEWPPVLGYNELTPAPGADVWATVGGDPLLCVDTVGEGRAFAYASDCAPHWASQSFLEWDGFDRLWAAVLEWVVGE